MLKPIVLPPAVPARILVMFFHSSAHALPPLTLPSPYECPVPRSYPDSIKYLANTPAVTIDNLPLILPTQLPCPHNCRLSSGHFVAQPKHCLSSSFPLTTHIDTCRALFIRPLSPFQFQFQIHSPHPSTIKRIPVPQHAPAAFCLPSPPLPSPTLSLPTRSSTTHPRRLRHVRLLCPSTCHTPSQPRRMPARHSVLLVPNLTPPPFSAPKQPKLKLHPPNTINQPTRTRPCSYHAWAACGLSWPVRQSDKASPHIPSAPPRLPTYHIHSNEMMSHALLRPSPSLRHDPAASTAPAPILASPTHTVSARLSPLTCPPA